MNINLIKLYRLPVFLYLSVLFFSGCTHVYKQPTHEINLAPVEQKIDLPVKLVLTDAFRNAKWERHAMGDTWILPIGDNLVNGSKKLVHNVFVKPSNCTSVFPVIVYASAVPSGSLK